MGTLDRISLTAGLALALLACEATPVISPDLADPTLERAEEPEPRVIPDEPPEAFVDNVWELQATFGDEGKMDLVSRASICDLIEPVARYGDALIRGGFVMGIEGTAVVGVFDHFGGYDLVWDLYSQQFTVSKHGGSLITTDELAITATAYVGYVGGFYSGVGEWYGFHEQASVEIGLPFLDDFFSVELTGFIEQDGVFGYTAGITVGVDAFPDPLPVEVTLSEGVWEQHSLVIRSYYDKFRDASFMGVPIPIKARLVDAEDGSRCHEQWPVEDGERSCVIELGDPEKSRTRRAIHVARSICTATKGCALPLTWPLAASALAVGSLRDLGLAPSELCPGIVDPSYTGRTLEEPTE